MRQAQIYQALQHVKLPKVRVLVIVQLTQSARKHSKFQLLVQSDTFLHVVRAFTPATTLAFGGWNIHPHFSEGRQIQPEDKAMDKSGLP